LSRGSSSGVLRHRRHRHRTPCATPGTGGAVVATDGTAYTSSSPLPGSSHVICAIAENLARETCVASLDLAAPIVLNVTKQCNGQSYAETLAYLSILCPHEVLMNEGRMHSPLARKVVQFVGGTQKNQQQQTPSPSDPDLSPDGHDGSSSAVVKFVSRSFFDQTKGAELLRRLARQDTYDSTLVEEYILLSASHALLHYTQNTLGAIALSKHCLDVRTHFGGRNRMEIDRSTLLQLELLTNAKTGRTQNSLIGTMDCTKTTVGARLLRTNLMSPPSRLDTIHARLDLVDTFLQDEDLFYSVLRELQTLPAIDKMLTDVAIIPNFKKHQEPSLWTIGTTPLPSSASVVAGKTADRGVNSVNARLASKGISALVCIKSTLEALPSLAGILSDYLEKEVDNGTGGVADLGTTEATVATDRTSLLIGMGVGGATLTALSTASTSPNEQQHADQLLRAIVYALTQPELQLIRNTISNVFSESTKYARNAHAMTHQECFALKSSSVGIDEDGQNVPNDDGRNIMDIVREAFMRNVDDIYRLADEYAEKHGMYVAVKYSAARGYFLSLPAEVASALPNEFIQPGKSGKHIHCMTEEIQSLNSRAQDNIQDLLLMTHERIQSVLDVARSKYDALARVSDAIALLDLCHSFADKVTLSRLPWSRPLLVEAAVERDSSQSELDGDSGIVIRNGRFGIDVMGTAQKELAGSDRGPSEMIPNDTFASKSKLFTVISGICGSGKSTYLKQIGIIVLLAHCGSYVPAEQAKIPVSRPLFGLSLMIHADVVRVQF
jgi:DNA mismatch repair protein MSH4